MKNPAVASMRARTREDRRQRVRARYHRLLKGRTPPKEAIHILAEEEARSPKTIYSILEGWR